MRKIGFSKFKDSTKEILPKSYKIDKITCQRKMFCTMINQYLSTHSQFNLSNDYIFEQNLLHIFEDKIMSFFQFYKFKPERTQRVVEIYIKESLLFNQYFKQSRHPKMRYLTSSVHFSPNFKISAEYKHSCVDLIKLIFNGKEIEMMLDLNEIFRQTVYNRIKKERDKEVTLDAPYIHISQNGIKTRLYPRWKHINSNKLKERHRDINDAFSQLQNEEIDQCYLVYPKTDSFMRHITLKGEDSQELKMIPYSFTFANRERKRCRK